jgi:hypothetical protein
MADQQVSTCAPHVEAESFTVDFDLHDRPIQKTVACMTDPEKLAALAYARDEFQQAERDLQPYVPLAYADYMPATLDAGLSIIGRFMEFERIRLRVVRLCDAVMAKGMN